MNIDALPREWDVIVVGAGVAGSVSAYRLARRGLSVLLVEKSAWPRDKVCGGCVNVATLQALSDAGLTDISGAGAAYSTMRLASGRRQALLPLPAGLAISRRRLDELLVTRARDAGVVFVSDTQAVLDAAKANARHVMLRQHQQQVMMATKLVVGCDGLASRLLRKDAPKALEIEAGSRIGVGATVTAAPGFYEPGTIHMACGPHGYAGLVRVENDKLNMGAALGPAWTKQCGGPAAAIAEVLRTAAFPRFDALIDANWQGTPQLTRRRHRLGSERVLIVGDAAGYVEPFTGEGMGWALAGAAAVEPFAIEAVGGWRDDVVSRWTARYAEVTRARQRGCQGVSMLLRHPHLMASLLPLVNAMPALVTPLTAWLNRDYKLDCVEAK
ncbi:MAG TPA: NAD(P)/FAD-dependent oxidoreductase [Modicisalibacter sp.]|nr:NAD(P)/FAD-dependent oxidoreductase [Modicisalibacter sp.]